MYFNRGIDILFAIVLSRLQIFYGSSHASVILESAGFIFFNDLFT
jgi:hypothetical protein